MPPRSPLAPFIDHTALRPDLCPEEVDALCREAREHGFATVCVAGRHVRRAARGLAGSGVGVAAVVGFPHGACHPRVKAVEAAQAVADGATELDVVADLGAIRAGDVAGVADDLRPVVAAARGRAVKAIVETELFGDEPGPLWVAAGGVRRAGARWIKTSTGFGPGGATVEAVTRLREAAGGTLRIKAAGGIRSRDDAERLLAAGADRLGSSRSVLIVATEERDA